MIKLLDILQEKVVIKQSFDDYTILVSKAYEEAPAFDSSVTHHWDALNKADHHLFKQIQSKIKIDFVSGEPYSTYQEMKDDVQHNKLLKISTDNNEHPIFNAEDNLMFRGVHDYMCHILSNSPFGAKGEIQAYNTHAKLFPKEALPALFTEVVGQASVAVVTGDFPIQKICLLYGFDYFNIGMLTNDYEKLHHHIKHQKELY